jgi:hypothetical protein
LLTRQTDPTVPSRIFSCRRYPLRCWLTSSLSTKSPGTFC